MNLSIYTKQFRDRSVVDSLNKLHWLLSLGVKPPDGSEGCKGCANNLTESVFGPA